MIFWVEFPTNQLTTTQNFYFNAVYTMLPQDASTGGGGKKFMACIVFN